MQINEFKAEVARNGMTMEELAGATGITRTTLWRRLSKPNEFELIEIKSIAKVLHLSKSKILDIFFADKVS